MSSEEEEPFEDVLARARAHPTYKPIKAAFSLEGYSPCYKSEKFLEALPAWIRAGVMHGWRE